MVGKGNEICRGELALLSSFFFFLSLFVMSCPGHVHVYVVFADFCERKSRGRAIVRRRISSIA